MRSSAPALRYSVHAIFAGLWVLGVAVFVLKHFFPAAGEFGPEPNAWQPRLLLMHGIIAVGATFLFGWICGDHVATTWRMRADRVSGVWLLSLVTVLIVTGFAAFFLVDDSLRSTNGTLHELLGIAFMIPWLAHLLFGRSARRRIVEQPTGADAGK